MFIFILIHRTITDSKNNSLFPSVIDQNKKTKEKENTKRYDWASIVNSQDTADSEQTSNIDARIKEEIKGAKEHTNFSKFETNPFYLKTTEEFIEKITKHYKNKQVQECTSFLGSFHNLFVQHIGKASKKGF